MDPQRRTSSAGVRTDTEGTRVFHVAETEKRRSSDLPETRFSLQAKLTLAFVLVSLIGFVVAFLLLPRIYVQSKEREIEDSKKGNVELLMRYFDALPELTTTVDLKEKAQTVGVVIKKGEQFDCRGLNLSSPLTPEDLLTEMRSVDPTRELDDLEERLNIVTEAFRIVHFVPWEVPSLSKRISLLSNGSGFLVPIIVPMTIPEKGFEGTLVLGDPIWQNELVFDPQDLSQIRSTLQNPGLLTMVSDILFYSAEEEVRGKLEKSEIANSDGFFSVTEKETSIKSLYVPVYNVEKRDEIAGYFCMVYEQTPGLLAWKDLVGGPAYKAFGVAALLAVAFSIFFAKGITRPIQDLTQGAIAIADGKLDQNVRVASRDEIGVLAFTFNEMTQRLRTTLDQLRERAETIEQQNVELDRQFNELRTLQNYTENILRTVDSAIFSVDLDGKVRRPNRAAQDLLGLEDDQEFEDVVSESVRDPLRAALDMGESTVSDEISVVSPEGEKTPVALSVSPLREGTEVTGAVAVLTDLQAVKNLEALVSRQERLAALGQLTAGVAHEIRNPLSIIKACAEILQQNFEGQPGENGLCRDIVEEVNRLSRVVSDFLLFAKPIEPSFKPVDLNELIETVVARLGKGSEETTRIHLDVPESLPSIRADADQVEQVLLNLIRNGSEAMDGEGEIVVRSRFSQEDETVWVEVEDRGGGMNEETRRRIFDPFFTSKATGTGLGLSICHRIMDSHGGSIQVAETTPGVGTAFRIAFQVGEIDAVSQLQGERART